jgi:hypothetical protein
LAEKAVDADWSLQAHYVSVLEDFPHYYAHNMARVTHAARQRTRGVMTIVTSVVLYAGAYLYMALGGL